MSDELSYTPMFGALQPDVLRFAGAPAWDEANDVLPESQWEEHDDLAPFCSPVRAQQNNNCTNAALGGLAEALFRAQGVGDVPRLSWAFLYAMCNDGRDQGAYCRDLADKFRTVGLAPEAKWPDSKILARSFPQDVLDAAAEYQALEVYQCLNWQHVGSALTRRFFVYHGFVLGNSYSRTGSDGRAPEWDGAFTNGHAMFSRGLTKRFGSWRTVTPNSWGPSFGDRGVGYWPESYFWAQRGNYVNLDAFAIRAVKRKDRLPQAG